MSDHGGDRANDVTGGTRAQAASSRIVAVIPRARRQLYAIVGTKILLAGLLLTGALFPHVGGFAGKGYAFRLPLFLIPALLVPAIRRLRRVRTAYPIPLDVALTVPFLLDTAGNAVGGFDRWDNFDKVLHGVNWVVLVWGVTAHLARPGRERGVLWVAGAGIGAMAAIGWELAEYGVMRAGVGGLHLTYVDTLGDLACGTVGGMVGALLAVRATSPRFAGEVDVPVPNGA